MAKKRTNKANIPATDTYKGLVSGIKELLEQARGATVRAVNGILTATYYEVGRRIVEYEQGGEVRAVYGEELMKRLAHDLSARHGRGFSRRNIEQMRLFYLGWQIVQTSSAQSEVRVRQTAPAEVARHKAQTVSALFPHVQKAQTLSALSPPVIQPLVVIPLQTSFANAFPLSWSQYVRLMAVQDDFARQFYEEEAIRGGWSVRQLDRQISTQFYERTALSRNKEAMLRKGQVPKPADVVTLEEMIRDPYIMEFLDLKDEYSETELEEAIIRHLETFLLEMGEAFTFVARQKRIRVGDEWFRMDLVLYHRDLRCLAIIDLKIGKFTHADAGQMNLYLNYAKEHLTRPGESEPVGLILCSDKNDAVVHYAMGGIGAKVFASRYLTALPSAEVLRREILATQHALKTRRAAGKGTCHE